MLEVYCELHICFRARANTFGKRNPTGRGCREPTGQLERPVRKGEVVTYLIQIVNEPGGVVFLKVLHPLPVLLPVKCAVELIGELG